MKIEGVLKTYWGLGEIKEALEYFRKPWRQIVILEKDCGL